MNVLVNKKQNPIFFSEWLLQARKEKKLSQVRLAQTLRTNQTSIANYEHGVTKPNFKTLGIICRFFNADANEILRME